jgi:hypothetical protein
MDWKSLLGSISESANDELRLRNEYLVAENRILRNQIADLPTAIVNLASQESAVANCRRSG